MSTAPTAAQRRAMENPGTWVKIWKHGVWRMHELSMWDEHRSRQGETLGTSRVWTIIDTRNMRPEYTAPRGFLATSIDRNHPGNRVEYGVFDTLAQAKAACHVTA